MQGERGTDTGEHVQLIMVVCVLNPSFLKANSRLDLKKVQDIDRGQMTRGNARGRTEPLKYAEKQTLAGTRAPDWERMQMKGDNY